MAVDNMKRTLVRHMIEDTTHVQLKILRMLWGWKTTQSMMLPQQNTTFLCNNGQSNLEENNMNNQKKYKLWRIQECRDAKRVMGKKQKQEKPRDAGVQQRWGQRTSQVC